MTGQCDVVVVGGGPAGLATAIGCRLRGLSVVLFEAKAFPIDKSCGEGLMPLGVAALKRLGVKWPDPKPFRGVHFHYLDAQDPSRSVSAPADFRGDPGFGLRRTELSAILFERAQDVGVRFISKNVERIELGPNDVSVSAAEQAITAAYLVVADGLHSKSRKLLSWPSTDHRADRVARADPPRYGVRKHFRVKPWSERVEVYFCKGFEIYITPLGSSEVGVAVLGNKPIDLNQAIERLGDANGSAAAAIRDASVSSRPRGAGPLEQSVHFRVYGRAALVGDAAGYVDAITGEGLSTALRCAESLSDRLSEKNLAAYESCYRKITRNYYISTRCLLFITKRRWLTRLSVSLLRRFPRLATSLLSLNDGEPLLAALRVAKRV